MYGSRHTTVERYQQVDAQTIQRLRAQVEERHRLAESYGPERVIDLAEPQVDHDRTITLDEAQERV